MTDTPSTQSTYLAPEHFALKNWWQRLVLSPNEVSEKKLKPVPSGMKAQLKRCETLDAVMLQEGFRELWFSLPQEIQSPEKEIREIQNLETWACIAALSTLLKTNSNNNLAQAAGKKNEGSDTPIVSEMRFLKLQNVKTPNEFFMTLRRIIQQVKGDIEPVKLAKDIQAWFREHHDFRPRQATHRIGVRWAMHYYRAAK